jgi:hypothetical protein
MSPTRGKAAGLSVLILCACGIDQHKVPQSSSARIAATNPLNMIFSSALRGAVVWTSSSLVVSADVALDLAQASTTVPLTPVSADVENQVTPVESVELSKTTTLSIYRPRLIVYEDVNGSGVFEPGPPLANGVDVVRAIDQGTAVSVADLLDLDHVLRGLSLEEAQAYYELTDGVYTPFIFVTTSSGGLALMRKDDVEPISLRLSDSAVPQEELACGRNRVTIYGDGTGATRNIHALVAQTLNASLVCGVDIPDCHSVDLANLAEPSLTATRTDAFVRLLQCRTDGVIQSLIVQEAERTCNNCVCPMTPLATVYFTDAASAPPWWPCGVSIAFCDSTLPLYFMDTTCPST